jgi:hypothetical protein
MLRGIIKYLQRHHIALLALFLALGGTSFAAASFINGKQIKPHSLPKNRLTNSAIRSLKGDKGAQGPPGQRGPTGAQGIQGIQGVQGPPGPFPTVLAATHSLYGTFNVECDGSVCEGGNAHFTYPLAAAPTVHYIQVGGAVPTGCSGSASAPAAAPGTFCAFEGDSGGAPTARGFVNPLDDGTGTATRFGGGFYLQGSAGSNHWIEGVWVVTGTPGSAAPAKAPASAKRVN